MDNINEIYVYENWKSDTPSLIGTLYVDGGRGKQVVSFEYDDEWLNDLTNNVTLDPDLRMFKGRQYAPADKLMFASIVKIVYPNITDEQLQSGKDDLHRDTSCSLKDIVFYYHSHNGEMFMNNVMYAE